VIHKKRFSGFFGTRLEPLLTSLLIERLVVCSVTTNICVESTVRAASQRDYPCFVVKDAVGEMNRDMHDAALRVMEDGFAKIVTVDDVRSARQGKAAVEVDTGEDNPGEYLRRRAAGSFLPGQKGTVRAEVRSQRSDRTLGR
jgi:hypothetical protein